MIVCFCDTCIYNMEPNECKLERIIINDDGECDDYKHYSDCPQYQNVFYKAIKGKDGKIYKRLARGGKVICNGFVLYYEAKDLKPDTYCTEERSGVFARYKKFCSTETAEVIRKAISSLEYKNVKDLEPELFGKVIEITE